MGFSDHYARQAALEEARLVKLKQQQAEVVSQLRRNLGLRLEYLQRQKAMTPHSIAEMVSIVSLSAILERRMGG